MFFFIGCTFFKKNKINIEGNSFSGQKIYLIDLDDKYKRTKNFNREWSKLYSNNFKPYHRLQNKVYTIIGTYEIYKESYLVIEDQKGNRFKKIIKLNQGNKFPSYVLFDSLRLQAEEIIGDTIWLNNTYDEDHFYTFSDFDFPRFEPVRVQKLLYYQNSDNDFPLWLEVNSFFGDVAYVRYNGEEGSVGSIDHYYSTIPFPKDWGREIVQKILNKKIELGLTERQLKISIGNPTEINITESRHGIGKQLVYKKRNGKKIYYQFEYGKLTYIND